MPNDEWQLFVQSVYCRSDTGELTTLSHPREPGMMWYLDSEYATDFYGVGLDGRTLSVQTPGGQWVIDSRANNCTRPDDKGHRCWVRHGVPPEINVDKAGDTCAAGAGSIMCGNYHGFLRNGYLEEC
ncbi:hypothetical protein CCAX7_54270 [Capsulimonas corticalis]|uniref:Uncharacterized protein n=1 Tax=Capsulimonas corticalis TaxID=2219043 RepID=A0A402CNH9_9BACT|nr:hypothetical protein [Capsulimonas corticalis]BDI33376.1 hypothetical protein CCAX7_54270 [Capsulimonas corticalis]